MERLNIEIKARCQNPEVIRECLLHRGADYIGTDHQVDTYFRIAGGRLKLREGNIENALIYYQRGNQAGPKKSEVHLYKPAKSVDLKLLLTAALGILTIVDKRRAIFFIDNVKFHLDEVQQLGTFIEIEAIDKDGSIGEKRLREQCDHYFDYLGIRKEDLIEVSYSDLIIEKTHELQR